MTTKLKILTIDDWEAMPYRDGNRYEIIEGELFVSCSPGIPHQIVSDNLLVLLRIFLKRNPIGTAISVPGLILSKNSGVIPDLVYFSKESRQRVRTGDRLTSAPDVVIEILSKGAETRGAIGSLSASFTQNTASPNIGLSIVRTELWRFIVCTDAPSN